MDVMANIPARASSFWRQIPARAVDRWIVAADLGQTNDPTAICVLHHRVMPLDTWTPNAKTEVWKQDRTEEFLVRHLERLPLGTSYPQQVEYIRELLNRPPLNSFRPKLVVDSTGVGAAVADIFDRAGLRPIRVTITPGFEATQQNGNSWHVPKSVLISGLDARLHTGELKIAAALADSGALQNELKGFHRMVSESGRVTWGNGRQSAHDDLVLAVAIALWWATSGPQSSSEELRI